jgi:hypothetical protein
MINQVGAANRNLGSSGSSGVQQQLSGLSKAIKLAQEYRSVIQESRQIWNDTIQPFGTLVRAGKDLAIARAQFKTLNLGADDTKMSFDAIDKVVKDIGGLRTSNVTADLQNLKSVVGDIGTAIEFLPTIAKQRFTFQALFQGDPKALELDIKNTMKALEQMGAVRQLRRGY